MDRKIIIKGAKEHNLKNIDVEIPKDKLVVFTGLSGSGKSSLAFDTIYAEGQRRYVESLSSYARQFLGIMKKPNVDFIEGLSPAISIDQKTTSHNPRSTVGTVTEVYDYLRLLYARVGHPHCPKCGREITRTTKEKIVEEIVKEFVGVQPTKIMILAPIVSGRKGEYIDLFKDLRKRSFQQVRIDGRIVSLNSDISLIKTNKHSIEAVVDKLILDKNYERQRILDSVEQALALGSGEVIISKVIDKSFSFPEVPTEMEDTFFSEKFACPYDATPMPKIEPRIFSFNSPFGACETCNGLGTIMTVDEDLVLNPNLTISEGGILAFANLYDRDTWLTRTLKTALEDNNIPMTKLLMTLTSDQKSLILYGTGDRVYKVQGRNRFGESTSIYETYPGVVGYLQQRYLETDSEMIKKEVQKFMTAKVCDTCIGARLKKESLAVTILDKSIVDVSEMSIADCYEFMGGLDKRLSGKELEIATIILKEINSRLKFLFDVGLSYLTLSRTAESLAGGEAQRIRLASQIGSGLSGVLYVLDEPSIGLHPRDNTKLIGTLKHLRDIGNSVLVVEHDKEMMQESDYIFDFGPGAGEHGGHIVSHGSPKEIINDKASLTGKYLSGKTKIRVRSQKLSELFENEQRQKKDNLKDQNKHFISLKGVEEHNLKKIDVDFPLGKFICITGVSGSGKSTLINDVFYHAIAHYKNPFHKEKAGKFEELTGYDEIKRIFMIDQSPIGRTPRSNPATYTGAFTYIRDIYANSRDARMGGYGPGRFSFNVKGGRCENCEGDGQIKIEMQFLSDVYVKCEVCNGTRYTQDTLEIQFEGKNISEVLNMSVEEAIPFFSFHEPLSARLTTLKEVGLSYIKLGQPATTLSGGEAQRIKLAAELSKKGGGGSLYVLDEPTTGLHFADLEKLIMVLRRLVDKGNTVVVIEHNLDLIKNSDYIIDLGPEGGDMGGLVIATGTPEEVSKVENSYTGQYLKNELK